MPEKLDGAFGLKLSRKAPTSMEFPEQALEPQVLSGAVSSTKLSKKALPKWLVPQSFPKRLVPRVVLSIRFPLPFLSVASGGPSLRRVAP